jgi:hypothetical protein
VTLWYSSRVAQRTNQTYHGSNRKGKGKGKGKGTTKL